MKITTLQQSVASNGVKAFIYGMAGVGKTPLVLTLPGHGLVVNAEAGLLSLMNRDSAGSFDVVNVTSIQDMQEVHRLLKGGTTNYAWVFIDSISEIAEVLIAEEKQKTKDPRQAYGALMDRMSALLRAFRDLPMDVVCIGKAQRVREEDTGRTTVEILIPGSKIGASIPYMFDEVFYQFTHVDKETGITATWLQTKSDNKVVCRDRSGRLDDFEAPNLGDILTKIKSSATVVAAE